jgi:DNA-binding CsgD family transcriptional regulator
VSDGSGNYTFSSLPSRGNYTITPTKAALTPGSAGINTVDVVATQRHFLNLGTPLSGCRLTAADVNGDNAVNTVDAIAIQRFVLIMPNGIANTGKYQFNPVSRSYPGVVGNQTAQNYDTLVLGDVASGFVNRPESPSQTMAGDSTSTSEFAATVAEKKIISQRFGFGGGERKTLQQIGNKLGVSRERIRQLENIALSKLRHALRQREAAIGLPVAA